MFLHLKMTVTTAPPPWVVGPERQLPAPQTHTLPDHLPSCSAPATLAALLVLHLHRFLSGACPHVSISLLPGRLLASLRCPPLREGVPDYKFAFPKPAQTLLPCFYVLSQHSPSSDKHQFYLPTTPLLLEPGTWVSHSLPGPQDLAGPAQVGAPQIFVRLSEFIQ